MPTVVRPLGQTVAPGYKAAARRGDRATEGGGTLREGVPSTQGRWAGAHWSGTQEAAAEFGGSGDGLRAQAAGREEWKSYPGQGPAQNLRLTLQDVPLQPCCVQHLLGRHQLLLEPRDLLLQLLQAPLTETRKPEGARSPQGETGAGRQGSSLQAQGPQRSAARPAGQEPLSPFWLGVALSAEAWPTRLGEQRGTHAGAPISAGPRVVDLPRGGAGPDLEWVSGWRWGPAAVGGACCLARHPDP